MIGIEFLSDFTKFKRDAKSALGEISKGFNAIFDNAEKRADTINRKVATATSNIAKSVQTGDAAQRKFYARSQGDRYGQLTADTNSHFRRLLSQGMQSGLLSRDDLRGNNRKVLVRDYESGALKDRLTQWLAESKGVSKHTEELKKNTAAKKENEKTSKSFFSGLSKGLLGDERSNKMSEVGRLEGNYFSRLRRQVVSAVVAYASFESLKRLGGAFLGNAQEDEKQNFGLSVPFGNMRNVVAARELASRMGTTGGTPFGENDMMKGFQSMMEAGVDPRKKANFNLFGNIAGRTGKSFSSVSSDITSSFYGNNDILRQYGFNNKQIFSLEHMVDQRPDARKNVIMGILQGDKRYKNGMRDFATSWEGMTNQLGNHWKAFMHGVMGDASDKNSLYSKIKGVFQSVLDWLNKNKQRIQRAAFFISEVFKWVVRQARSFMAWIARGLEGLLSKTDGNLQDFRTKTMKFILLLELTKERVVRTITAIWSRWGWLIKDIVKIWLASKIVRYIGGGIKELFSPITTLLKLFGKGDGLEGAVFKLGQAIGRFTGTSLGSFKSWASRVLGLVGPIAMRVGGLMAAIAVPMGNSTPAELKKQWETYQTQGRGFAQGTGAFSGLGAKNFFKQNMKLPFDDPDNRKGNMIATGDAFNAVSRMATNFGVNAKRGSDVNSTLGTVTPYLEYNGKRIYDLSLLKQGAATLADKLPDSYENLKPGFKLAKPVYFQAGSVTIVSNDPHAIMKKLLDVASEMGGDPVTNDQ